MLRCLVVLPPDPLVALRYASLCEVLKRSGRAVILLAPEAWVSVFELVEGVDEVRSLKAPEDPSLVHSVDEILILDNRWEALLAAYRWNVPSRYALGGWLRSWFASTAPRPKNLGDPKTILQALHLDANSNSVPKLEISAAMRAGGRDRLKRARLSQSTKMGWIVGALPVDQRRFHWKKNLERLRELRKARPHWDWVLLTLPEDLWSAVRIHEEMGRHLSVVGPDLKSEEWPGVLSQLNWVAGGQPFLLNLAAASGVSVLTPPGSRELQQMAPRGLDCHRAEGDWVAELLSLVS